MPRTRSGPRCTWIKMPPAAIAYDMQARYKVGNLVKHPKFGLGVVKTLIGVNKVEILFEEGLKLLRCS